MIREFGAEEIDPLAIGAWIFGTGGGGSPYLAQLNLKQLYADGKPCRLIDPLALEDDDYVAVVSKMGAPLVGQERLVDPAHLARAVQVMEEYLGKRFRAIMSVEIGGGNAISPFLAGAVLDLPVVDADAMGRAYPEAQMTSFAIGDLKMYPLSLVDCRDNEVVVARTPSWKWMERISRKVCTEVGSTSATCKAPRTGQEVKEWGVLHTVTKATRLGRLSSRRVRPIRIRSPPCSRTRTEKSSSRARSRIWTAARPAGSFVAQPRSKGLIPIAAARWSLRSRTNGRSGSRTVRRW